MTQVDLTPMYHRAQQLILFSQLLHDWQSPRLTPFRPFPCDVCSPLNAVLINATSPNILFQDLPTFSFQLFSLTWSLLVKILNGGIRTTFWGYVHMARIQMIDLRQYINFTPSPVPRSRPFQSEHRTAAFSRPANCWTSCNSLYFLGCTLPQAR